MKTRTRECRQCGKAFPAKPREVYCSTECGYAHRRDFSTTPPTEIAVAGDLRRCPVCSQARTAAEWGKARWACRTCIAAYMKKRRSTNGPDVGQSKGRRLDLKVRCANYLGSSCKRCGFTPSSREEYAAFDFHHRSPATKRFGLAGNHSRKWEVIQEELDMCDLLCANCHRIIHVTEPSGELAVKREAGRRRARLAREGEGTA